MMPDLDGLEVCRRLRSQPSTSQIPIIMFTAKSEVGDKVDGFQSGADDYLTKPIHPNDLAARVDAALQRSAQKRLSVQPTTTAQVIGLLGVRGGVGTTTLALNLAAAMANADGERRVIWLIFKPVPQISRPSWDWYSRRSGRVGQSGTQRDYPSGAWTTPDSPCERYVAIGQCRSACAGGSC